MSRIESLWPQDLMPSDRIMPEDILREQARALSEQTNGVLTGSVGVGSQGDWITLSFFIVAPLLDDYSYQLLKVRHKPIDPFSPLEIVIKSSDIRRATSREEFEAELAKVFGSDATRSLIGELLSLSKSARTDEKA
jgi:hypothetical protein